MNRAKAPSRTTAARRILARAAVACLAIASLVGCSDAPSSDHAFPVVPVDPSELHPGGDDTADRFDEKAFSQSNPGLGFAGEANFKAGNLLFRNTPAGLGPLFNTQTCQGCHNQDGRGQPPSSPDEPMVAMLLKLGVPDPASPGHLAPDPTYGDQLQTFGIDVDNPSKGLPRQDGALPRADAPDGDGAIGEAYAFIEIEELPGAYPDGETFVLHRPIYALRDLSYGPLSPNAVVSPRVAPSMIGLGLLEAIPEDDILAHADPDDHDRDGISGRPNRVVDAASGATLLGRIGLKAGKPSILQQAAAAYTGDIGVTNSFHPTGPCTSAERACLDRAGAPPEGAAFEIDDVQLALVEFYGRNLAVPERRGWDADSQTWQEPIGRGRELFQSIGCAACHVPTHRTGAAPPSALGDVLLNRLTQPGTSQPALSEQTIWPYTDLLLHDMGGTCAPIARERADGSSCDSGADCFWVRRCDGLADGMPEGEASGSEWRTAPLWGLGLVRLVNPKAGFLHDGRAHSIEEAILWHGGEAAYVKQSFMQLDRGDRQAILAFLDSQ